MQVPRLARRRAVLTAWLAASALGATVPSALAATQAEVSTSISSAVSYMRAQQTASTGGFSSFGGNYALSAIAAGGVNLADVKGPGLTDPSAQDFYYTQFNALTTPDSTAILFGYAAGLDPQRLSAQTNLVANLATAYNASGATEGSLGNGSTNLASFSALALARVKAPPVLLAKINAYLRTQRHTDGGWDFPRVASEMDRAGASGTDITGNVIAALCESGADQNDPDVRAGLAFIKGKQVPATGAVGNPDTTGWVISGLNACGIDPQSRRWTTSEGKNLVDGLLTYQVSGGAFALSPGGSPNFYATQDAVRALAGESFSAEVPRRANAMDARFRAAPIILPTTVVPHAIVIDNGTGGVRFCKASVAVDAPLTDLLTAARSSSAPAGCVTTFTTTGGAVSEINGDSGTWRVRLDTLPEADATTQTVGFGQTVTLRRAIAPGQGAPGKDGANGQNGMNGQDGVDGQNGQDGVNGQNGANGNDGANGQDGANGNDGAAGSNGSNGVKGSDGAAGTNGKDGAAGTDGQDGANGNDGAPGAGGGRALPATCRTARAGKVVRCTVTGAAGTRVTLARGGRTYATGRGARLVATRRVKAGRYVLRFRTGGVVQTVRVTVA